MSLTVPELEHGWTARSYAKFRVVFGLWLAVHFAALVPWAAELFSSTGALADPAASPLARLFPNVLVWTGHPIFATFFVGAGAATSLCFAAGYRDRWLSVFLWYLWACLLGRNPLIANPGIPYVGWLLLLHAMLPRDDAGRATLPEAFYAAAWIVMVAGYSYGGLTKLGSPSWLDGSALARVLESPLARDTVLRTWLTTMPEAWLRRLTWATLALEILAVPLALSKRLRPWLWLTFVALHFGILATVDFADLTLGMLTIHALTFDPAWLRPFSSFGELKNAALATGKGNEKPRRERGWRADVSCDACGKPRGREGRHPAAEASRARASGLRE